MQKLRLQNVWNNDTKSFDKNNFELRESEKTISGKVSITSKKDDGYISKPMPFIAFKCKVDKDTLNALLNSRGKSFEAEFGIVVDSFKDNQGKEIKYHKLVINKAKLEGQEKHYQDKANGYQPEEDQDDSIPF